jgi:hypothetical protein
MLAQRWSVPTDDPSEVGLLTIHTRMGTQLEPQRDQQAHRVLHGTTRRRRTNEEGALIEDLQAGGGKGITTTTVKAFGAEPEAQIPGRQSWEPGITYTMNRASYRHRLDLRLRPRPMPPGSLIRQLSPRTVFLRRHGT